MKSNNPLDDTQKKDEEFLVTVKFTHDKEIASLNKEFRGKDIATDVLSFNMDEQQEDGSYYLGDIVVNLDQAKRQASTYGNDLKQELAELVGHGLLHLLGVHHEEDDHA